MNQYKHLLSFDLSSYGAALALINQFVDNVAIKVLEVSPCGTSAQLILLGQELISLQVIKGASQALLKSQILDVQLIENIHTNLLSTYLSQNTTALQQSLLVIEGDSLSKALCIAQNVLQTKYTLVDFRVVRTFPKNIILTVTSNNFKALENIETFDFKKSFIEKIEPSLKSYYE